MKIVASHKVTGCLSLSLTDRVLLMQTLLADKVNLLGESQMLPGILMIH